jgi:hypothetical protein
VAPFCGHSAEQQYTNLSLAGEGSRCQIRQGAPRVLVPVTPILPHSESPWRNLALLASWRFPNAVVRLILSVLRQSGGHDSACSATGIGSKS